MKNNFHFENKNVIILLKSFALGGAEKQALFLANYLQEKLKCNVFVYSFIKSENSKLFDNLCDDLKIKSLFIENNPLSASGRFKYLKRRIKIFLFGLKLKKHHPDIIIPYLNPSSIIASLCYKVAGAKYTFWHHRGPDYFRYDKLEKKAVKKTPIFIANSKDGEQELMEKFKLTNSHYFLPNFSTVKKVNKNKKLEKLNFIEDKIVIGMIAHFRIQKLQNVLLRVFNELLKKYSNIHLVFAGNLHDSKDEESNFEEVTKFIKQYSLDQKVTIIHNVRAEEVLPYIHIGVLISLKEGMPNTIMEYMAYSLPVVATNHEGCISLLGEKYPYYINNQDKKDQFDKLKLLIQNENERNFIGEKNKQRLDKYFTIESYIKQLTATVNQ